MEYFTKCNDDCNNEDFKTAKAKFKSVLTLNLENNLLTSRGINYLSMCTNLKNVRNLNLSNNNLGLDGVSLLLGDNYKMTKLTNINLSNTKIGLKAMEAFNLCKGFNMLKNIDLSYNNLGGGKTIKAFFSRAFLQLIESINLDSTNLGAEDMEAISHSVIIPKIINLANNHIGPKGVEKLVNWQHIVSIVSLNLNNNKLGNEGFCNLLRYKLKNLETLNLDNNDIGDEGFEYFTQKVATYCKRLHILSFNGNNLSNKIFGFIVLSEMVNMTFKNLDMKNNPRITEEEEEYAFLGLKLK